MLKQQQKQLHQHVMKIKEEDHQNIMDCVKHQIINKNCLMESNLDNILLWKVNEYQFKKYNIDMINYNVIN